MGLFSAKLGYDYGGSIKDRRKTRRRSLAEQGWVRLNDSFAVRPCRLLEASNSGVRIVLDRPVAPSDELTLMTTRSDSSGRRVKVKWRRGLQVGAEFC